MFAEGTASFARLLVGPYALQQPVVSQRSPAVVLVVTALAMATAITSNLVSVARDSKSSRVLDDHLAFAVDMQGQIRNGGVVLGGGIVAFKAIIAAVVAVSAASRRRTVTTFATSGACSVRNGTILATVAVAIKIAALTGRIGTRRAASCTKDDLGNSWGRIEDMASTEHIGGFVVTVSAIESRHHL